MEESATCEALAAPHEAGVGVEPDGIVTTTPTGTDVEAGVGAGATVGAAVGVVLGAAVGAMLGVAVAAAVGVALGAAVGAELGFVVGFTFGVAVATGMTLCDEFEELVPPPPPHAVRAKRASSAMRLSIDRQLPHSEKVIRDVGTTGDDAFC